MTTMAKAFCKLPYLRAPGDSQVTARVNVLLRKRSGLLVVGDSLVPIEVRASC